MVMAERDMNNIEIIFNDSDSTAQRLLKATQALIARYGYDATTTRMIANLAQVNLSAINFHYGNKERLVQEAVQKAADDLQEYYDKLADEIRGFLKEENPDKDRAWSYIDHLLANRIRRAFDFSKSWINIGLAEHENGLPESCQGTMAQIAIESNEKILAELIMVVGDKKDVFQAGIIARAINAAIMSYAEKPLLNKYLENSLEIDLGDLRKVEETLHEYFMRSIEAAVVAGPMKK